MEKLSAHPTQLRERKQPWKCQINWTNISWDILSQRYKIHIVGISRLMFRKSFFSHSHRITRLKVHNLTKCNFHFNQGSLEGSNIHRWEPSASRRFSSLRVLYTCAKDPQWWSYRWLQENKFVFFWPNFMFTPALTLRWSNIVCPRFTGSQRKTFTGFYTEVNPR